MSRYSKPWFGGGPPATRNTERPQEALDHATSYRHGQALSTSCVCCPRSMPTLCRCNGGSHHVGIRRRRGNPPPLGVRRLRALLLHLHPAHDTLSRTAPE